MYIYIYISIYIYIYIYTEGGGGHYILCKRIIQINVQKTIISALGMAISFLG